MRHVHAWWVLAGALAVLAVVWMLGEQSDLMTPRVDVAGNPRVLGPTARQALLPLPDAPVMPADKVALGERLFADKRLSADGTVSCLSCHHLKAGGADGLRTAVGVKGRTGTVNTPTVFNAHLNFVQFWDGRARTLAEQAAGPIQNPLEMAANWPDVLALLRADPVYSAQFQASYAGEVSARTVTDAIAAYEHTLVTPNSRFDRYLRGQGDALNAQELEGYRVPGLGVRQLSPGCGHRWQPFSAIWHFSGAAASRYPGTLRQGTLQRHRAGR